MRCVAQYGELRSLKRLYNAVAESKIYRLLHVHVAVDRLLAFVIMIILLVRKASSNNVPSVDNTRTEARKTRLSLDKSTDSHS